MNENAPPGTPAEAPVNRPEPDPAAPRAPLEQLLAEAQARLQDQREASLRSLAAAENARKRAQLDVASAHKFGAERLVEGLLPVMDSLEAALAIEAANAASLRAGVELTLRQLQSVLERANVVPIDPAPGDRFDPHQHQAIAAVVSEAEPNTVVSVMQKGYALHDRVIRPALVSVAKARDA